MRGDLHAGYFLTKQIKHKMKQLHRKLLVLAMCLTSTILHAQEPFWVENFSNNIPAQWTNTDASGQGVVWKWCANNTSGCSPVFTGELPFQSATAASGFVHVNSDAPGQLMQDHLSQLTTPVIDCSGKNEVFIKFQSHIGTYNTTPAASARLRVSTDMSNWQEFMPFPDLQLGNEFSPNPYISILDISSAAANQPTVYIQWQWRGNWEYMWDLDDIELYGQNPTPKFDLVISNFFYPASSFATPFSQIGTDTFGFSVTLTNRGLLPATNTKVKALVEDAAGHILFADSVLVETLMPGTVDSFVALPGTFVPDLPVGEYVVSYSVVSDSTDDVPSNNFFSSPFVVTDFVFSKEDEPQVSTRTASDVPWFVGNYYLMSGGQFDQYKAMSAEFALGTTPGELDLDDVNANIFLFKVHESAGSDFSNFDLSSFPGQSLEWIGFAGYETPEGLSNGQLQQVELLDFETSEKGILLEPGGRYFLVIGYPQEARKTNHYFNTDIKYFNAVSTVVYSDQWYLGGFGDELAAVMRMYISLASTADEKPLPASTLNVYPNPASTEINLAVGFGQPTDATITIADLSGRVVRMEDRQGLTQEVVNYRLDGLSAGVYLARIATKAGTRTVKFAVQ